jgi:hypothetical protein
MNRDRENFGYEQNEFQLSSKSNSLKIQTEYENFKSIDDHNMNRKESRELSARMKRKKKTKYVISLKYKIFLIVLWLIFLSSFIVGFILHFDVKSPVSASSILWAFSFCVFCVCVVYSVIFYKAKHAKTQEELGKYLKFVPV